MCINPVTLKVKIKLKLKIYTYTPHAASQWGSGSWNSFHSLTPSYPVPGKQGLWYPIPGGGQDAAAIAKGLVFEKESQQKALLSGYSDLHGMLSCLWCGFNKHRALKHRHPCSGSSSVLNHGAISTYYGDQVPGQSRLNRDTFSKDKQKEQLSSLYSASNYLCNLQQDPSPSILLITQLTIHSPNTSKWLIACWLLLSLCVPVHGRHH